MWRLTDLKHPNGITRLIIGFFALMLLVLLYNAQIPELTNVSSSNALQPGHILQEKSLRTNSHPNNPQHRADIPIDDLNMAQLKPSDPKYNQQSSSLSSINIEAAWDITTGNQQIKIAIIDDAIDIRHQDLRNNILTGSGGAWDFVANDADPSAGVCEDNRTSESNYETHGTQVAGVIGAVGDNNFGLAGINWQVGLMPLRIGCSYPFALELSAIQYAIDNGAAIVNLSYGSPLQRIRSASEYAKILEIIAAASETTLFVVSAGNQHVSNDDTVMFPANLPLNNVISVAASNNRQLTEWTQYGAATVDFAAPGVDIYTTETNPDSLDLDYGFTNGTSFSAPIVSGIAGLILAKDLNDDGVRNLSPADVKGIIQAAVKPLNAQFGVLKTDGEVNAANALDIMYQSRPVVTIVNYNYSDELGNQPLNHRMDANETGSININLVNLWDDALTTTIRLLSEDKDVVVVNAEQSLAFWQKGEKFSLSFPLQLGALKGYKRYSFTLDITAIGSQRQGSYQRKFNLQNGILLNNQVQSRKILINDFDDYQYFHINIPNGADSSAIQMEYTEGDSRDMGLLASLSERPVIHFSTGNAKSYWYQADKISDAKTGFERIDFKFSPNRSPTIDVMAFNAAESSLNSRFQRNKSYSIKACFFSENDGNSAPRVNAGADRIVVAGATVVLKGIVSDIDGEIERVWWRSNDGIPFISNDGLNAQFIAPSSGTVSFLLSAIDNGCKKSADTIRISVKDQTGEEPGFQVRPSKITIEENSTIDVFVSAFIGANSIDNLSLTSKPSGMNFFKSANGNRLIWENAGPIGTYSAKFTASVDNETIKSAITIEISARGSTNGGGGCVAGNPNGFDPMLIIYVLISLLYLAKNRIKIQKN